MKRFPPPLLISFLVAVLLFHASAATAAEPFAAVARQTFADLLKVPVAAPAVSVTVIRTETEEGLVIEEVEWRALDGETVPAIVIRPAGGSDGRLPAIICLHGSSGSRESMTTPQFGPGEWTPPGRGESHTRMLGWARELARQGYVTLSITQRGLDRRTPFVNVAANLMLPQGRTMMGEILQEIRQGVTYLTGRDDVDPGRIGASGMSFGGITSFYVWLLDGRVKAAAPICGGVGSVRTFIEKGSPGYHGTYWWIPNMLKKGDQGDFAAAMAPRPLMLWAPTSDIGMPRDGVDAFVDKVRPAYERAGAGDAFVAHQPAGEHSFTLEAFEALKGFFDQHLGK